MVRKLFLVIFVLSLSVSAFAQEVSSDKKTTIYATTTDIKVREAPPTKGIILISGPGKVMFDLAKNSEVIVLEKQVIESVFKKTIWIKIRDLSSKKDGWMYWGDNEEKSDNLTVKGVK